MKENILETITDAYIKSNLCEDCTNCQYKTNCHTRNSIKTELYLAIENNINDIQTKINKLDKVNKSVEKDFINLIHHYINDPNKLQKDLDTFSEYNKTIIIKDFTKDLNLFIKKLIHLRNTLLNKNLDK